MKHSADEIIVGLEDIIRDIFDEYNGPVTPALTAKSIPQWDSLANVQFMVMVEEKFKIKFTTDEITGSKNLGELAELIGRKAA